MIRKLLFFLALFLPLTVGAQVYNPLWKLSGGNLLPVVSTWGVGSPTVPIKNGYFTNLFASTTSFTSAGGALDMGGFAISDSGTITATNFIGTSTSVNNFRATSGTAGAPSYSFTANTGGGMYLPNPNQLGFSTNGTAVMTLVRGSGEDQWAHPTTNGTYFGLFDTGALEAVAGGTNQNITLTPSGTGLVYTTRPFYQQSNTINALVMDAAGASYGGIANIDASSWALGYTAIQPTLITPVLTWNNSGNVGIASSTPFGLLSVNPNGVTGDAPYFAIGSSTQTLFMVSGSGSAVGQSNSSTPGQTLVAATDNVNISVTRPGLAFISNPGTGISADNPNQLTISSAGAETGRFITGGSTIIGSAAKLSNPGNNASLSYNTAGAIALTSNAGQPIDFSPGTGVGVGTSTPYATTSIQTNSSTGDAFAVATSSKAAVFGVDNDGHHWTSGPAGAISSCGTGSGSVVGDDQSGDITTATAATACTLTFSKAYRVSPVCTVTDNSLVGFADISSVSVSAVTFGISSALTGGHLYYQCVYHQ